MPAALQYDLELRRGQTARIPVRWESEPWQYAAIASISRTAPVRITTADPHAIPEGWRCAVVDAQGITNLNAVMPLRDADLRRATVVSDTLIEFNEVSSAGWGTHRANTGYLAWRTPKDLAGYAARMQIKDRIGGTVLHELTTENDGISINVTEKVIELYISDEDAEAWTWASGVYDLEMVSASGEVTALLEGAVTVGDEVTTPT